VSRRYWLAVSLCFGALLAVGYAAVFSGGLHPILTIAEPPDLARKAEQPEPAFGGNQVAEVPSTDDVICWKSGDKINCRTETAPSVAPGYEEALGALFSADFVYNRVDEMWHGTPVDVVLKLVPPDMPAPLISEALEGERKRGSVKVSPEISADLVGSAGLDVSPSEIVRKKFSLTAPTSWQWKVLPTKPGNRNLLTLTIYAHFDTDPPYTLAVYEDQIDVKVGILQRARITVAEIQPLWAFAAAAIPTVLGAIVWFRRRLRREGDASSLQADGK